MSESKEQIKEILFQGLGYVSLCWNPRPTGIFDSTNAETKGREIEKSIDEYAKECSIGFRKWENDNFDYIEAEDKWYLFSDHKRTNPIISEKLYTLYL